jgi:hypothetical protein
MVSESLYEFSMGVCATNHYHLLSELYPLSFSPKGEMENHSFPPGGRLGRGYQMRKEYCLKPVMQDRVMNGKSS